jgi:hypothetical protein
MATTTCGINLDANGRCSANSTQNQEFCKLKPGTKQCVFRTNPDHPTNKSYTMREIRQIVREKQAAALEQQEDATWSEKKASLQRDASTLETTKADDKTPSADKSSCHQCVSGRCPVHTECDEGTCQTHVPTWRRFCGQFPLSNHDRQIVRRWLAYVSPDLSQQTVDEMSDARLCEALTALDAEWRRPLTNPQDFECDGDDLITSEPLSSVPHEVLGTFVLPASKPGQTPRTRCADIRGVDMWWDGQASLGNPRTVPQFHRQEHLPYFKGLIREWDGRMRFYKEQFAPDMDDMVAQLRFGSAVEKARAAAFFGTLASASHVGRSEVIANNAIAPLVALLQGGDATGKCNAALALAYLAVDKAHVDAIMDARAIGPLVVLLQHGDARGKQASALAISHLALNDRYANLKQIVQANAMDPLVELLRYNDNDHDKESTTSALASITTQSSFWMHTQKLQKVLSQTLRTAIVPLVLLLQHGNAAIRLNSARVVFNIACIGRREADVIVKANAIVHLVALQQRGDFDSNRVATNALKMLAYWGSESASHTLQARRRALAVSARLAAELT